nr:hypothetical protein CFP56_00894 [Quercus suber]
MIIFRICVEQDSCALVTDPCLVNLASRIDGHTQIVDCTMIRVDTGDRGDRWKASISGSLVTQLRQRNVHIFALTAFHHDGMVSQTLFTDFTRAFSQIRIPTLTWSAPRRLKAATELKKASFIVDDSDGWEDSIELGSRQQDPDIWQELSRHPTAVQEAKHHRAMSYRHVCRELDRQQSTHNELADRKLELALRMLQGIEISETVPFKTFLELQPIGIMSVDNIKEVSARLEEITNVGVTELPDVHRTIIDGEQTPLTVHHLAWSHGILEVYQHMIDDWISPLSTRITGRLRISKDSMLRNAAAEVALATRLLRADLSDDADDNDLPRTEDISSPILTSLSQQDSGLPTPSLTATPSVTTAPSVSTNQASTIYTSAEISRLSKYTTFTPKPASTHFASPLPRSLGNVLSHWSVGTDPQEYDWVASTHRILMQRYREDEEGMGEKEQMFARKKVERHIKRQRREAEEMERNRVQSSQATMVMSSQLPVRKKVSEGSRSVASSGQLRGQRGQDLAIASQVVPGRFGGRPEYTPKKRKRKQGF